MKELSVRNAWEVWINDMDMTAIAISDKPIIPAGMSNAPVLEVLKMRRSKETRLD